MTVHPLKDHVKLNYHSSYAAHVATIPTRAPIVGGGTGGTTAYTAWDTTTVDGSDMMTALVTALLQKFPSTVFFDSAVYMQRDDPDDTWNPIQIDTFVGQDGEDGDPGWTQAVQSIFSFKDSNFNFMKLELLDTSSRNNFARRSPATADADELAIAAVIMSDSWAFASRAGFQPVLLWSISLGINDELKKQYPGI